jgi:uncharacterized membrane protein YidH (DUF202 family)
VVELSAPALLDVGAQAERTALAWQRTGLALLGVGAAMLHLGEGAALLAVGVLDLAAGAIVAAVVGPVRYARTLRQVGDSSSPLARRSVLAVTACTVATAVTVAGELVATR